MSGSSTDGGGGGSILSPERWPSVEAVLDGALELAVDEVPAYLERACAGEDRLRQEVERLLVACREATDRLGFLESPAGAFMAPVLTVGDIAVLADRGTAGSSGGEEPMEAGELVGPYRVLRQLGRGGMGVVYLADDPRLDRRVALKVVKRGMDTSAILDRFRKERLILAGLEHPNIARLLDGGATSDGRPYFVLELVAGLPLDRYCDERSLGLEARIRLFIEVCRAVQYAHGRLVVHRDLKPSNILVTAEGQVKLLDFGIAKVLGKAGEAAQATLTTAGVRALTPEYAAPEHLRGEPVTTVADVYSLGVVLYRLLTGTLPFRLDRRSQDEAARLVSETDPTPPSRVAERAGTDRQAEHRRRARRLRGDLDAIVLTALRHDAARRYASVDAFSQDLRRYLESLPVQARPDSAAYRATRFVRRHRIGVASTAAVVLTALAATVTVALEQAETARERDRARLEAEKLAAAQDYLVGLFSAADPAEARGEDVTARQLVRRGVEQLDTALAEQPLVQLEMLKVLSRVEHALGDYRTARDMTTRALQLAVERYGEAHVETAAAHGSLGMLNVLLDDLETAEQHLRQAVAIRRQHPAEEAQLAGNLDELGRLHLLRGDNAAAREAFEEALAIRRRLFGDLHEDVATTLNNYGAALTRWGEHEEAERHLREALAIRTELVGRVHPAVASSVGNLAATLRALGRFEEAESFYREALELKRILVGEDHPSYTTSLNNLAVFMNGQGAYTEAATLFEQVLELDRKQLGDAHHYVAVSMLNLARALAETRDFARAMPLFADARALLRATIGTESVRYAACLHQEALALHYQARDQEAVALLNESVELYERVVGSRHPERALALARLGRVRFALAETDSAIAAYRSALAIQREALPDPHPETAATLAGLAVALLELDRVEEAERLAREAVTMVDATLPARHRTRTEAHTTLAAARSRL